jgi:hypothetical protein
MHAREDAIRILNKYALVTRRPAKSAVKNVLAEVVTAVDYRYVILVG